MRVAEIPTPSIWELRVSLWVCCLCCDCIPLLSLCPSLLPPPLSPSPYPSLSLSHTHTRNHSQSLIFSLSHTHCLLPSLHVSLSPSLPFLGSLPDMIFVDADALPLEFSMFRCSSGPPERILPKGWRVQAGQRWVSESLPGRGRLPLVPSDCMAMFAHPSPVHPATSQTNRRRLHEGIALTPEQFEAVLEYKDEVRKRVKEMGV